MHALLPLGWGATFDLLCISYIMHELKTRLCTFPQPVTCFFVWLVYVGLASQSNAKCQAIAMRVWDIFRNLFVRFASKAWTNFGWFVSRWNTLWYVLFANAWKPEPRRLEISFWNMSLTGIPLTVRIQSLPTHTITHESIKHRIPHSIGIQFWIPQSQCSQIKKRNVHWIGKPFLKPHHINATIWWFRAWFDERMIPMCALIGKIYIIPSRYTWICSMLRFGEHAVDDYDSCQFRIGYCWQR